MLAVLGKHPSYLYSFPPMPYQPLNAGGAGDRGVFMSPEEAAEVVAWLAERRGDLARIGLRAMIAGTLAAFMTACVIGMMF